MKKAVVDTFKCTACAKCVSRCPEGAMRMEGGEFAAVIRFMCTGCGQCAEHCPVSAIIIR